MVSVRSDRWPERVVIERNSGSTETNPSPIQNRRGGQPRTNRRGLSNNFRVFTPPNRQPPLPRRSANENETGQPRKISLGLGAKPSNKYNAKMPLSNLLALDRPYLRPVIFVPAQIMPVLFQNEEEIMEAPKATGIQNSTIYHGFTR